MKWTAIEGVPLFTPLHHPYPHTNGFQSHTIMFLWMRRNDEKLFREKQSHWKSKFFVGLWSVTCVCVCVCVCERERVTERLRESALMCLCVCVCDRVWPSSPRVKSVCYSPSSAFLKVLSQRKANPISFNWKLLRKADFIRINVHPFFCPSPFWHPSVLYPTHASSFSLHSPPSPPTSSLNLASFHPYVWPSALLSQWSYLCWALMWWEYWLRGVGGWCLEEGIDPQEWLGREWALKGWSS